MSNENEKMVTVSEKALAALISDAVATVIAQASETQPKAETIETLGAKHEQKRTKNQRKRQSQAKKSAPAPKAVAKHYDASKPKNSDGFVTGLLAKSGTSYQLIDKAANRKTQCNVIGCRTLRRGRSRFCSAHHKENGRNMFAKNGVRLNETKR